MNPQIRPAAVMGEVCREHPRFAALRMKECERSDELQFLMELSIEPIAAKLGLLTPSA